jgi:hypothetical protein
MAEDAKKLTFIQDMSAPSAGPDRQPYPADEAERLTSESKVRCYWIATKHGNGYY